MTGGKILDQIEIDLKNRRTDKFLKIYIDVYNSSLSRKWLDALNHLLLYNYHLEKNYCWFGFPQSQRNITYLLDQINASIKSINESGCGYKINDTFTVENTIHAGPVGEELPGGKINHDKLNQLHRYFEDLQGTSGAMSLHYTRADSRTKWHIRQLNLLCHEYESLVLSVRKKQFAPEWMRPSQLMCWLNAPRFNLDVEDFDLFGIETINRPLGGVFIGVNKAIGKHHWEVFQDEGPDSVISDLTTTSMRSQTEAAGDFDIEWANDPGAYPFQKKQLAEFRQWLVKNNFDPDDKQLTIGFPQCGQVDLLRSFGTTDFYKIWEQLENHQDVYSVTTTSASAVYNYCWSDSDFVERQISVIEKGHAY